MLHSALYPLFFLRILIHNEVWSWCQVTVYHVSVVCFSLVKMVFGFASRSNSMPTWHELQHAILRNFGGLDDVKPVQVFAKHLRLIDEDAPVCSIIMMWPCLCDASSYIAVHASVFPSVHLSHSSL